MIHNLELASLVLASLVFLLLAMLLVFNWREGRVTAPLFVAAVVTSVWAAIGARQFNQAGVDASFLVSIVDVIRVGAWFFLLATILRYFSGGRARGLFVSGAAVLWGVYLIFVLLREFQLEFLISIGLDDLKVSLGLASALLGLLLVEQIYRNSRPKERVNIRYFCLGVGLIFVYDLFFYSHAFLISSTPELVFAFRGIAYAASAPLIALSAKRNANWSVGIFVSRQVVFYSTSLLAVGFYFVAMASVGYLIRSLNSGWGGLLQTLFFIASISILVWVLFSDSLRASLKVWLHKNFYENKYDYREEWLRLIATLATNNEQLPLGVRSAKALAQIVESPSGVLWILSPDDLFFRSEFAFQQDLRVAEIAVDHPLIEFLEARRWVVDLREMRGKSEDYEFQQLGDSDLPVSRESLLVPLQHEDRLLGFVELSPTTKEYKLNYEDHDLLKTAGQQIASYLEQSRVANLLSESRQFEAFSKFTAFVMHDLKNLIAQQSLILQNSERHRENPDFVDDSFKTIANSVARMQSLLDQLRNRSELGESKKIRVGDILEKAVALSANRKPVPQIELTNDIDPIYADPDRLLAVFGHLIRNAQEASSERGSVTVRVVSDRQNVTVEFEDNGNGMSSDFIRDQLFQPFISTKGSQGMGIGAYQAREYARIIGGELNVESRPGVGTVIRMQIPTASV